MKNNLVLRILSALVLAPVVLGVVLWGSGSLYGALVLGLLIVGYWEWAEIVCPRSVGKIDKTLSPIFLALLAYFFFGIFTAPGWMNYNGIILFYVLPLSLAYVFFFAKSVRKKGFFTSLWLLLGQIYLVSGAISLLVLRFSNNAQCTFHYTGGLCDNDENGLLILFLLFVVWGTDVGAYIAGKTIGGPKICPRISPNKTWAGLFGGMALASLAGYFMSCFGYKLSEGKTLYGFYADLFTKGENTGVMIAPLLAIISQIGDFFESFVKRKFGVKDSGALIPGHGGLLDRVDGLIFAAVSLALFALVAGSLPPEPQLWIQ